MPKPLPPKFRSYYRRLHHRAAIEAMAALIDLDPSWESKDLAPVAADYADDLIAELKRRETAGDDIED
ncbi:hypothetical protein [Nodosilinea sp. E11]|uniref:hypothetical protein n=1 Tax=Nodosilinea sp. E11 TaxID=3037479 RepID=UPI0029347786|nr:hypothetical protein [Nodosilinea sp. E11]WOD37384.1 hypothetical protein RRF56_02580 [Nodosilinea sp. E11]WOD37946.1 hypothetical protein RRF56_17170 [Nodosilinea sp. E11]